MGLERTRDAPDLFPPPAARRAQWSPAGGHRSAPHELGRAESETGVPASAIKEVADAYGRADRAMICWTLGITEHHNAVDNVLALINLALLTGKVGRYG